MEEERKTMDRNQECNCGCGRKAKRCECFSFPSGVPPMDWEPAYFKGLP